MLTFEGIPRRWLQASFGEPDADLSKWREKLMQVSEEEPDDDDLRI